MGYYVDLETPLQVIPQAFAGWIQQEIQPDGLLEEVEKLCVTYRTAGSVLTHEIWIHKLDWTIDENETYSMNDTMSTIIYPFQVAIIVDTLDDEEAAEQKAIQLQAKTIMSIFKNYSRTIFPNNEGWINFFKLDMGFNDGSLTALNQEDDVVIKGFQITLNISIDWLTCMHKKKMQALEDEDLEKLAEDELNN
jgi:hypothetical protein